jgi:uncharacterized caspase-like protein
VDQAVGGHKQTPEKELSRPWPANGWLFARDNPFISQQQRSAASRSIGRGLAPAEPEPGTLVVYAAKHGETALDGDGLNSPFASSLVKRMSTRGLEVRRLFVFVRDDVLAITDRRQQPFSYGSLPGNEDFFFIPK